VARRARRLELRADGPRIRGCPDGGAARPGSG
jgi:hypothetical protein